MESIRWQGLPHIQGEEPVGRLVGRDQALFDVWIHELGVGAAANSSTLEMSLREINRADIILVLYTGEAGSAHSDEEIGICHAELQVALARRNELVVIVDLLPLSTSQVPRDISFRSYVDRLEVPRMQAQDESALQQCVAEILQERTAVLVRRGGTVGARKRDRGQALDWSRLDLTARQKEMCSALIHNLPTERIDEASGQASQLHLMKLPSGLELAVRIEAIPAALSVAAARERVGQPFMQDHLHAQVLESRGVPGVVHLIACHSGVTETQATRMLGTPDAMSVASDFGVYVADHVQKIQIVFLSQCGDETAVALAVRRFHEWLVQTGEETRLVERAKSRARILKAVADEQ
ncbi:MAG: hypothetical protein GJT30_03500 [Geobacter sp.]|nr:hypothetical protein [Geobacter sp.]